MIEEMLSDRQAAAQPAPPPRIGFLGTGWIGRLRMDALLKAGAVEAVAIADPSPAMLDEAAALAPAAARCDDLDGLLAHDLDGVVIATPSALHAEQAIRALEQGVAVFCQKPLGRNVAEAEAVVNAARRADRLLAVDLSYRYTSAMDRIRQLVREGALGRVYAADLVFHNAYGPDKPWCYDPKLSGGGCVMDLGVHLVDLALWMLDFPEVERVESALYHKGEPLAGRSDRVEDYATATLHLAGGAAVRIACSWELHAGCNAVIGAAFHGSAGGAEMRNIDGSFFDFVANHHRGTGTEQLVSPPDDWGGRAAADWARRLRAGQGFDAQSVQLVELARTLDRIYGR